MLISDWISDVCSSDLLGAGVSTSGAGYRSGWPGSRSPRWCRARRDIVHRCLQRHATVLSLSSMTPQITLEDLQKTARDSFYVTVGLGVIAFQKAQVQRHELRKQLEHGAGGAQQGVVESGKTLEERP